MKLDVYDIRGKKLEKQAELPAAIFEAPINNDLMHQAYVRQMANGRIGTHSTKGRSEVSGGGRQPCALRSRSRQPAKKLCWWMHLVWMNPRPKSSRMRSTN